MVVSRGFQKFGGHWAPSLKACQNFLTPEASPLEFFKRRWGSKTREMPLTYETAKKFDDASIRLDTIPALERPTDGRTEMS